MATKRRSTSPLIRSSLPAAKRAAKAAWRLSVATDTPFVVWKDGKVVDLNQKKTKGAKRLAKRSAKPIK